MGIVDDLRRVAPAPLQRWIDRPGHYGAVDKVVAQLVAKLTPPLSAAARSGREGAFSWRFDDATLRIEFPYAKQPLLSAGVKFRFEKTPAGQWWVVLLGVNQQQLDGVATALRRERRPAAAAVVEHNAREWIAHASAAVPSTKAGVAAGRLEVMPNGFVKLWLRAFWKPSTLLGSIVRARKDASGAWYSLFKAKRATLVAEELAERGFFADAEVLRSRFGRLAETVDASAAKCDPLREMADAPNPEAVRHPIGRAVIEDVREAVRKRMPANRQPFPFQIVGAAFARLTGYRSLNGDSMGLGKAQALTSKVLTPAGWTTIGALRVGDAVIDPDGGVGFVEGIFPQGVKPAYRVETTDGGSTVCCDEHLWCVQTASDRQTDKFRVLPLKELLSKGIYRMATRQGVAERQNRYFLPVTHPVVFRESEESLLDGYALGVLLGDGNLTGNTPTWSKPEPTIADEVRRRIPWEVRCLQDGDTYSIISNGVLRRILIGLGVWGKESHEKTLPASYQYAAVDTRWALLRGLMDIDGDCTTNGVATFNTSSPFLADGVVELVRGLGGFATISRREEPKYVRQGEVLVRIGRPAYRVNVRVPQNPFLLDRKAERWHKPLLARAIYDVTPLEPVEMACIRVSTKRHLYVTDDHIVTHNTIQALTPIALEGADLLPAIVVCPASVQINWQREIAAALPTIPTVLLIKKTDRPPAGFQGIVITKYSTVPAQAHDLADFGAKYLIADESQRIKNDTAQSDAVLELAEHVPHLVLLSGTPIENRVLELWRQLHAIDAEKYATLGEFGDQYAEFKEKRIGGGRVVKAFVKGKNLAHLREDVKCWMIRRMKQDVLTDLPEKTRVDIPIDMDASERAAYNRVNNQFEAWLKEKFTKQLNDALREEGINPKDAASDVAREVRMRIARSLNAEAMTKIGELRHEIGRIKVPYVLEQIESFVESETPVVVFAHFRDVIDALEEGCRAAGARVVVYDGSTSAADRQRAVDAFQAGQLDVIIGSTAMAVGLTLTRAYNVIMAERFWTPTLEEQAEDRTYRIGQKNAVTVWRPCLTGTFDERMAGLLEVKQHQIREAIGDAKVETSTESFADIIDAIVGSGDAKPKRGKAAAKQQENPKQVLPRNAVVRVVFQRRLWTLREARSWLRVNGLTVHEVVAAEDRIVATVAKGPAPRVRTMKLAEGVSAVVAA